MPFKWRDNSVRILALLMAVLLWVYVTNEQNPVTDLTYNVPLELRDELPGYVIDGIPRAVNVQVKGTRSVIGTLQRDDFVAYVNLPKDTGVGELELPVQLSSPPGVEVLRITPQVVRLQVDKIVSKNVPVVVSLKGDVAGGRQPGEPVVKPQVVEVRGPSRVLEKITRVGVTVDISGAGDTLEREVTVDTETEGVTVNPRRVAVTVPVTGLPVKNLPVRVILTGEPAAGYTVSGVSADPSPVQVVGRDEALRELTSVSTMPVDIAGITGDVEREAVLVLPEGATSVNPDRVVVTVQVKQAETEQPPLNDGGDTGEPGTSG